MAKKNRNQNRTSQKLIPQKEEYLLLEDFAGIELESGDNIKPIDEVNGFKIRPGFYEINGASALPEGVNFTLVTYPGSLRQDSLSAGLPGRKCVFYVCFWTEG